MMKKIVQFSVLIIALFGVQLVQSAPKIIAFDLHGVLLQRCSPLSSSLWDLAMNANNKLDIFFTTINPFFWAKAYSMTDGTYSCEKALHELSSYSAVKENYDALFHACNDYCPIVETVELVKKLKNSGVKLVLASNIGKESYEYEKKNPVLAPVFALFDFVHFAHEDENSSKPSINYFIALRKAINNYFGINNNTEILFIDDNYKNIQGSDRASEQHKLNIKAIHYKNPDQLQQILIAQNFIRPVSIGQKESEKSIVQEKPVIIDFFATWCGPCQALGPILEELESEYGDKFEFRKIDVDKNPSLSKAYNVESMPTIIFERNGRIVYKHLGFATKEELKAIIRRYFE